MDSLNCYLCGHGGRRVYSGKYFNHAILCHHCLTELQLGIYELFGEEFIRSLYNTPHGFFHELSPNQLWPVGRGTGVYCEVNSTEWNRSKCHEGRVSSEHHRTPA